MAAPSLPWAGRTEETDHSLCGAHLTAVPGISHPQNATATGPHHTPRGPNNQLFRPPSRRPPPSLIMLRRWLRGTRTTAGKPASWLLVPGSRPRIPQSEIRNPGLPRLRAPQPSPARFLRFGVFFALFAFPAFFQSPADGPSPAPRSNSAKFLRVLAASATSGGGVGFRRRAQPRSHPPDACEQRQHRAGANGQDAARDARHAVGQHLVGFRAEILHHRGLVDEHADGSGNEEGGRQGQKEESMP